MKINNIKNVKKEAFKLINCIKEIERTQGSFNSTVRTVTSQSKETSALKRSSMDLTRSLSLMRNDTF